MPKAVIYKVILRQIVFIAGRLIYHEYTTDAVIAVDRDKFNKLLS